MRIYQLFVATLCISLGALTSLTSGAMVVGMLLAPETRTENLFWVAVVALALSPPIFVAGWRLLLNKPNSYGGIFTPIELRLMAVFSGIVGALILFFAYQEGDLRGMYGGISFLVFTQGGFVLANKRAKN